MATREAAAAETEWRGRVRAARTASDSARDALAQFERARAQTLSRLSAVEEAFSRAGAARNEAAERKAGAETALDAAWAGRRCRCRASSTRARLAARERTAFAEARATAQSIARETAARAARRAAIAAERSSWDERLDPCAKPHRRARRAAGGSGARAGGRSPTRRPTFARDAPRARRRTWPGGIRAQGRRRRARARPKPRSPTPIAPRARRSKR